MSQEYLDFELPIAELEAKIESLRSVLDQDNDINLDDEIARLQKKSMELTEKTFANLDAWQVSKMSRHPNRPYTLDYIEHIFTDFDELAGDRAFADDKAIIGGLARLDGRPVMVIGHQKGRTVKEKVKRNFGGTFQTSNHYFHRHPRGLSWRRCGRTRTIGSYRPQLT